MKTLLILLLLTTPVLAEDFSDEEIVQAIYLAEGGTRAKKPFGILSIPCNSYEQCKKICRNTVRNNRRRFTEYGRFKYGTYLEFLASRYAPTERATNDPYSLNRHWLKNVKFFLAKNRNERQTK